MTKKTSNAETLVTTKAPVLTGDRGLQFSDMESMWRFCVAVVGSRQFKGIDTPEIALVMLQAGLELGLSPIWALTNVMVVNGKPAVWGDALLGLVLSHKDCEDVIETMDGDDSATCEVHRKGRLPVKRTFTVDDAKKAGLYGKTGPWTQYPKRMLQMRARSWACRDSFADALRGLGVVEEYRDVEPKPIQAREVDRPKLILPDEQNLPVPVLAEPTAAPQEAEGEPLQSGETRESNEVGDLMPSAKAGVVQDSRGGQEPLEVRNEKGEFEF